jgi:hypothetical protein
MKFSMSKPQHRKASPQRTKRLFRKFTARSLTRLALRVKATRRPLARPMGLAITAPP